MERVSWCPVLHALCPPWPPAAAWWELSAQTTSLLTYSWDSALPYCLSPSARGLLSLCGWAWKCETGVGAPTVTNIPWWQELMDKYYSPNLDPSFISVYRPQQDWAVTTSSVKHCLLGFHLPVSCELLWPLWNELPEPSSLSQSPLLDKPNLRGG